MSKHGRGDGLAGYKPLGIYIDEIDDYGNHNRTVRERLPAEGVVIPPYGQDHQNTKRGDQIVILNGDQFGWRGTVTGVARAGDSWTITANMVRLDGSRGSQVTHRGGYVGRILKEVPRFEHPEEADAWLDGQLREPVQEWATGTVVVFSCPPHMALRLMTVQEQSSEGSAREWQERFDDLEAEGRITKFMPWWEAETRESAFTGQRRETVPGYELLVTLDGEPDLIEVAARRIKRLA